MNAGAYTVEVNAQNFQAEVGEKSKETPVLLEFYAEGAEQSAAVSELQRITGAHFASAQGGCFASPAVAEVLAWLEREGVPGIGQSSWGPTGFALLSSEAEAQRLLASAVERCPASAGLRLEVRRGQNCGAAVVVTETALAAES